MEQQCNTVGSSRDELIEQFLKSNGVVDATRMPIAGDASFRRYERIGVSVNGCDGEDLPYRYLILMDAPPPHEDIDDFVRIDEYLYSRDYSVPHIVARDSVNGLLLLEDFGDASFFSWLQCSPDDERKLYEAAIDVVAAFYHDGVVPVTGDYSKLVLDREISLFGEWFLPLLFGGDRAKCLHDEFMELWNSLFSDCGEESLRHILQPQSFVHRDFHAQNLFWLVGRDHDIRKVGMIDFQDALIGRAAYDVASLLEDARRDVSPDIVSHSIDRFLGLTCMDRQQFELEYSVLAMQRNAKILGIFTRLCKRDGKPDYLRLIPRVWRYFLGDIEHDILRPVKLWVDKHFTEEVQERIISM